LATLPDKPCDMTRQVMESRTNLEGQLKAMEVLTEQGMMQLAALQATYNSVENHKTAINRNQSFTWDVEEPAWRRDPLPAGVQYVTNCRNCARTCHSNCAVSDKKDCCMFSRSATCMACALNGNSCFPSDHHNDTHIFVLFTKKVPQSNEEMKKKYNIAKNDKDAAQKILDGLADEFLECQMNLVRTTEEIQDILLKLSAIALRPAPTDNIEYIKELIAQEKAEKNVGWDQRVAQLNGCLEQAEKLKTVREEGFDPLSKVRAEVSICLKGSTKSRVQEVAEQGFWQGCKDSAKGLLSKMHVW